jgi:hypothetical protein
MRMRRTAVALLGDRLPHLLPSLDHHPREVSQVRETPLFRLGINVQTPSLIWPWPYPKQTQNSQFRYIHLLIRLEHRTHLHLIPVTYLQALSRRSADPRLVERSGSDDGVHSERPSSPTVRQDPPAYSPLDAYTYADGVHIDLPAEFITAALEGTAPPASSVGQGNTSSSERRRSRRR